MKEEGKIRAKAAITVRRAKTEQIYEERKTVAPKSLDALPCWGISQQPYSHKCVFVVLAGEDLKAFKSEGVFSFIHKL